MNVSDALSVLTNINEFFDKKNDFAKSLEKYIKNKKNTFNRIFWLYFFVILILSINIALIIKRDFLNTLISNNVIVDVIIAIITTFNVFPFMFLLARSINIEYFFDPYIKK